MEIDAFLADSAEAVQGKIYAMGIGWNTIHTGSFPAVHSRIAIGIVIHVPYTATNQVHTLSTRLLDEDGNAKQLGTVEGELGDEDVFELTGSFNVGRPPELQHGDEQIVPIALSIEQLRFEGPGAFSWVISVDDVDVKRLPMRVQLVQ